MPHITLLHPSYFTPGSLCAAVDPSLNQANSPLCLQLLHVSCMMEVSCGESLKRVNTGDSTQLRNKGTDLPSKSSVQVSMGLCAGSGWDGVNFVHSSSCGAVFYICNQHNTDDTLKF